MVCQVTDEEESIVFFKLMMVLGVERFYVLYSRDMKTIRPK